MWTALLDAVFPPKCASCGALVSSGPFCSICREALVPIERPMCVVCGSPFAGGIDHHLRALRRRSTVVRDGARRVGLRQRATPRDPALQVWRPARARAGARRPHARAAALRRGDSGCRSIRDVSRNVSSIRRSSSRARHGPARGPTRWRFAACATRRRRRVSTPGLAARTCAVHSSARAVECMVAAWCSSTTSSRRARPSRRVLERCGGQVRSRSRS